MKTNKFTLLILGFAIVTIGALLKILKIDNSDYLVWLGLVIELIAIIKLISNTLSNKGPK
ncbi:MAG: hypothetical protein HWD84_04430 [Flavobacteriaceae bacterium]|jgi:hypothetical protein|nr:hypothetical protein [Flavobacteriaceae bacterium]